LIATLLVMIVPIAGAARAQVRWRHHLRVHDIVMPRRPISPLLVAIGSAVLPLILTITLNFPRNMMIDGTLRTVILFLSFALTISYMLRMLPLGKKSVWVVPIGWIFLTFAGPILIDLFYHSLLSESRDTTGILSTLSPPAALFDIWSINPIGTDLALVVGAGQAIAVMIIFYLRRRTISPPLSPPSPTPSFLRAN
jgi:hypothetical protein